jgi:hypothetical protein
LNQVLGISAFIPVDCLDRVAHETAHLALHGMSNAKLTQRENLFLDEGIALFIGYRCVGELTELNALSQKIASEDRQNGQASLAYLRDWEKNVREKQRQFVNIWKRQNPAKEPSLDDLLKGGYRTYFTAYSFVRAVVSKHGLPRLLQVVRNIGKGMSQADAFKMATGQSLEDCIAEWHAALG